MVQQMAEQSLYVTATQAAEILGIRKAAMWRLLRDGAIPFRTTKSDRRLKLILRADVEIYARENPTYPKNNPQAA